MGFMCSSVIWLLNTGLTVLNILQVVIIGVCNMRVK